MPRNNTQLVKRCARSNNKTYLVQGPPSDLAPIAKPNFGFYDVSLAEACLNFGKPQIKETPMKLLSEIEPTNSLSDVTWAQVKNGLEVEVISFKKLQFLEAVEEVYQHAKRLAGEI